jgi:hypothetical protein
MPVNGQIRVEVLAARPATRHGFVDHEQADEEDALMPVHETDHVPTTMRLLSQHSTPRR